MRLLALFNEPVEHVAVVVGSWIPPMYEKGDVRRTKHIE